MGRELSTPNILWAPAGIVAYQIYLWLKHAVWMPIPISYALREWLGVEPPHAQWAGVQTIVAGALDLPLSGTLIMLTLPLVLLELKIGTVLDRRFQRKIQRKMGHIP